MGIFFTLLYVFTAYTGLPALFPVLAPLHIELLIAIVTLLCSIPSLPGSKIFGIPQTYAVMGLCAAVALSMLAGGWAGGAVIALTDFLPDALLFFFVLVNFKKKGHLQLLVAVLVMCALSNILQGYYAIQVFDFRNVYLEWMKNGDSMWFPRLRGLTFLNDPNDLAQFMVGLIPCMFFFWVKGKKIRNFVFVIVPAATLFFGMYLTHSRGGMLAIMMVVVVAGRKKLGVLPAMIGGGLLFIGISAAGFAGGRDISMESGADRMDAWAAGLKMIRAHPIFGVGYGRFTDAHPLTAHNTVVLCAAELGLFGLFCWMLLMVPTVRDALVGSGKKIKVIVDPAAKLANLGFLRKTSDKPASGLVAGRPFGLRAEAMGSAGMLRGAVATGPNAMAAVSGAAFATSSASPVPAKRAPATPTPRYDLLHADPADGQLPVAELQRMASVTLVMLSGFLTAGWFLSRAYTMSVFLYAGIAAVVYRMGREREIVPPPMPFSRAARAAAIACVCAVTAVWVILRVNHLMPQ
jgi:O-antigen ligase